MINKMCETCIKPNEGKDKKCPGNLGLGCVGDWRCCAEIDIICEGCKVHNKESIWFCDKEDCEKIKNFRKYNYI